MTKDDTPVCYLIMRTDMASLNPGKAMAQAHHAYGALNHAIHKYYSERSSGYRQWIESTPQGFGTVVVLGGDMENIQRALEIASNEGLVWGWVNDPTYPINDGSVTHLISVVTCAFVFGSRQACGKAVSSLSLHK